MSGSDSGAAVAVASVAAAVDGGAAASAAPGERRRSSVLAVTLGQRRESGSGSHLTRAAAVAAEQARLTLVALGLALIVLPLAPAVEAFAGAIAKAMPGFAPTEPCEGLLSDRQSITLVTVTALGGFFIENGVQFSAISTSARAYQYLRHTLLVGGASAVAMPLLYSFTTGPSPNVHHVLTGAVLCVAFVFWVPFPSHAAWQLAAAKRKSVTRAAMLVAHGTAVATVGTVFGTAVAFYVTLSKNIDGLTGVTVNGLCFPVTIWLLRVAQRQLLHSKVSASSRDLDFAGVIVLLFEIFCSTPQFYLLATYVVGVPAGRLASGAASIALTRLLACSPRSQDRRHPAVRGLDGTQLQQRVGRSAHLRSRDTT
jgi:hypothetical protein